MRDYWYNFVAELNLIAKQGLKSRMLITLFLIEKVSIFIFFYLLIKTSFLSREIKIFQIIVFGDYPGLLTCIGKFCFNSRIQRN